MALFGPGTRPDRVGDGNRLVGQAFGLREDTLEHPDLGERGEDQGPLPGRLVRDKLHRPHQREDRAFGIAGAAPVAAQALVQETHLEPVRPLIEAGDRRLGVRRGVPGAVVGKGRLRRPAEQVDRRGRVGAPPGRLTSIVDLEGQLEVDQGVGQRIDGFGLGRRIDRGRPRRSQLVGRQPVPRPRSRPLGQPFGQGRVVTAALARQEIRLDRPGDQRVANADDRIGWQARNGGLVDGRVAVRPFELGKAMLEGVRQAVAEVRLEDAPAAAGCGARTWSRPVRLAFERQRRGRQLLEGERLAGRSQQAQDPPALGRTTGQASDDELVERAGERRAGQLAASGQELLGDQGVASRPFRDEEQDRGRRALALDRLDQPGELIAAERINEQPFGRAARLGHRRQCLVEGMATGQLVRLVGGHHAQPAGPRYAG